jgi:curved DNA-binding protein CbpA
MEIGDFGGALYDFHDVKTQQPDNEEANEASSRALEAKKNANRVDYYAALEVDTDASIDEIHAAYKRAARQWHSDRFPKREEKQHAHDVMRIVNRAYEVLSDPAKREAYDAGGDWEEIGFEDLLKKTPEGEDGL